MNDQQRLLRLLKLISYLASPRHRSVPEYAELLDVDRSTVYRYLETIKQVGYILHQDEQRYHYIDRSVLKREHPSLTFTADEANILNGLVRGYATPLKSDLLNKIYLLSAQSDLAQGLADVQQAVKFRTLHEAMEQEKQVVLKQYVSMNSKDVRDRRVEPIRFRNEDTTLEAFDTEKKEIRHFQLERMGEVKLSSKGFKYRVRHDQQDTDPFQVANLPKVEVELMLTITAAQQMKEHYPATQTYLLKRDEGYRFCAPVNEQFILLDAFLMGCCREVRIIRPIALTKHLEQQWQERTF